MSTIKIRRGVNASLPAGGTVAGEPRFSTDTGQLYIDDGTNNIEITPNATNVTAAGALMDSELTDIASVKALNQGVATTDSPTFAGLTVNSRSVQYKTVTTVGATDADYITDGTADDVQIQAAIDAVNAAGGGKVLLKKGTYNVTAVMTIGSNTTLEGEEAASVIIKKVAGQNSTVFNNKDSSNGNTNIVLRNLTIDQDGANQTSGGGASFTGLFNSTIENVIFEKSYVFNLFVGSMSGTAKTGTITATLGDTTITGSGTAFTTELAVGGIIKTAGGRFGRVRAIASDTSLELDRAWGHATESGVAFSLIPANSGNRIINCVFNGTVGTSDNVGLGLFDDSIVRGCESTGSTGYGFGPDHTNNLVFEGNTLHDNTNAGIGMETVGYSVIKGNISYGNSAGIYLLSGAYRNVISENECYHNTNGIVISYNVTSFPKANENLLLNNVCEDNTTVGINVDGVDKTVIRGNRCANNGAYGIRVQTGNSSVPDKTELSHNYCYDNQDTKVQQRGIYVINGTNTMVTDNYSLAADHTTAGLTDSGTGTVVINTDSTTNTAGRTALGLVAGGAGDIWVEKAGDTMTGNLTITNSAPALYLTESDQVSPAGTYRIDSSGDELRFVRSSTVLGKFTSTQFDLSNVALLLDASSNSEGLIARSGSTHIFSLYRQATPSNASAVLSAYGGIGFATGATGGAATSGFKLTIDTTGNTYPGTDSAQTLGTSSLYWSNTYTDRLYLNSTAYLDGASAGTAALTGALSVTGANGTLTLSAATDGGEFNIGASATGTLALYGSAGNTLHVNLLDGNLTVGAGSLIKATSSPPASAGATGTTGQIEWDSSYIYICIASNTWQRVAHATW